MRYYLFHFNGRCYRIERDKGPRAACKLAFGMVYDARSSVRYKDAGTRTPRRWTVAEKAAYYSDEGWLPVPDSGE